MLTLSSTLTDGGRLLTRTENLLACWLDDERAACCLAPFVSVDGLTEADASVIEDAVILALVSVLEDRHGEAVVEYCGGERRDLLRSAALHERTASRLL
jgi:hypothetical protein